MSRGARQVYSYCVRRVEAGTFFCKPNWRVVVKRESCSPPAAGPVPHLGKQSSKRLQVASIPGRVCRARGPIGASLGRSPGAGWGGRGQARCVGPGDCASSCPVCPALHSVGLSDQSREPRLPSPSLSQSTSGNGHLLLICTSTRGAHGDPGGPSVSRDTSWEASDLLLSLLLLLPFKSFSHPQGEGSVPIHMGSRRGS